MFTLTDDLGNMLCLLYITFWHICRSFTICRRIQLLLSSARHWIFGTWATLQTFSAFIFCGKRWRERWPLISLSMQWTGISPPLARPAGPDSNGNSLEISTSFDNVATYPILIGELQHLFNCNRPDIARALSALDSFTNCPTEQHWEAANLVCSYSNTSLIPTGRAVGICPNYEESELTVSELTKYYCILAAHAPWIVLMEPVPCPLRDSLTLILPWCLELVVQQACFSPCTDVLSAVLPF